MRSVTNHISPKQFGALERGKCSSANSVHFWWMLLELHLVTNRDANSSAKAMSLKSVVIVTGNTHLGTIFCGCGAQSEFLTSDKDERADQSIEQTTKNVQQKTSSHIIFILLPMKLRGASCGQSAKQLEYANSRWTLDSNAASKTTQAKQCTAIQFFIIPTKTNATEQIAQSKVDIDPTS